MRKKMKYKMPVITRKDRLREESSIVDLTDVYQVENLKKALLNAYDLMGGACQGISAVQVGYPRQAILLRFKKGKEPVIVFNPILRWKLGSRKSNEGCLSEGNVRYNVRRPILCMVTYYKENGKKITRLYSYRKARIWCHELDHLKGVLLEDIKV